MAPIVRNYAGEDAEEVFINWLVSNTKEIHKNPALIKITKQEKAEHKRVTKCWICNEEFTHEKL